MADEEKVAQEVQEGEETGQETAVESPESNLSPEEQYESAQEEQARAGGWKPLGEFIEQGGEVGKWVKADAFNVRTGLIGELRHQKKIISGFEGRIANLNQVHAAELEVKLTELKEKRDAAALEGGVEGQEKMKNAQHQIDKLNSTAAIPANTSNAELEEWNERNPWINEAGPKSAYARTLFTNAINQGWTVSQAIAGVEQEIVREYPVQTRSKPQVSETERGSKPGRFNKSSKKLTMNDITTEERASLDALPRAWANKSEEEILQAVQDAREGESNAR